jgi:hypothetical protein
MQAEMSNNIFVYEFKNKSNSCGDFLSRKYLPRHAALRLFISHCMTSILGSCSCYPMLNILL